METTEFLQHNSQIYSLDISHIVSKHFGSIFTSDCIDPEIIENLKVSQGSTDENHVRYVSELVKITNERQNAFDQNKYLRDHIILVRDKSLRDDEKAKEESEEYAYLNLPRNEPTFLKYIDNELLRKNGLIAPADVIMNIKEDTSEIEIGNDNSSESNFLPQDIRKNIGSPNLSKMKECHLPPIENLPAKINSKKKKIEKYRKPVDMVLATEKDESKFMLDMMDAKNNYLKNQRHLTPGISEDSKGWLIQKGGHPKDQKIFLPIPEIVEFSDYEVGKVYQQFINFRNMTTVLRNIRVLPPRTRYFSLGLGQFPGDKGLVAPGISCQYAIRFSPDSLGDYEDEIVVETQGGNCYPVKIIGKRPRPILTGSTLWNMNHCLVYGLKVVHYKIKNIGGSGKFCIADSTSPPVAISKAEINSFQTILEPFVIRPNHFELRTNETINLELIFCPKSVGEVEREFIIICDNCHAEKFKISGKGEIASIIAERIEDGASIPELDEAIDISAQMLVKFSPLNPLTYCQRTVVLKNESHTEIPFCWKIVKPNLKSPFVDIESLDIDVLKNRTLDFDSAFMIEPSTGIFPPNEYLSFTITFAPLEVKSHHSVLHLVLQGIPDFKPEQVPNTILINEGISKQKSFMKNVEDMVFDMQSGSSSLNTFKMGTISLNDVTSLEIEVKGISIPLNVRFNTPSIIVPGELLINTPVRKQLQIINDSTCPISLIWDNPDSEDYIFEVEPKFGLIDSLETGVVDVCIVANKPGFFRSTLKCHVETMEKPLELVVEASFKGPDIEIDINDLDFGLVKVHDTVTRVLKLFNKSSVNCSWRTKIGGTNDVQLFNEFNISPRSGIVGPLQNEKVVVSFTPKSAKRVDCELEIALENSSPKYLHVLALVQCPTVILSSVNLDITGQLYICTPSNLTITMYNQTSLQSKFKWQMPIGKDIDHVSIITEPSEGVIKSNGKFAVRLIITCGSQMEIQDLLLPCLIEEADEPIGLNIFGKVLGPSFTYKVFDKIEDAQEILKDETYISNLNFENNVPLFQDVKKYLCLQNITSIVTDFDISIDYFKASLSSVDSIDQIKKKRPNLADRQSKPDKLAHFDFCKSMLKLKNGLAVSFKPSHGKLQSFDKVLIEVTAYNDMWGEYKDFVRITGKAQNVSCNEIVIPLSIGVVGNPLEFTMTAGRKEQKPILRLGSKPFGEELLSKKIRLNNKSCCDIYINWEMYKYTDQSNENIIDVLVNIDDPFPLNHESLKSKEMCSNINSEQSTERNYMLDSNASNSYRVVGLSDREEDDTSIARLLDTLISVVIRPCDGVLSNGPIRFQPQQLHIPAESYGYVTVLFDPQYLPFSKELQMDENDGINFHNFLLGILSLDKHDLINENRIIRSHQYSVENIKLDITGRIILPSLEVDYPDADENEDVFFQVPFSSLLIKDSRGYSLSNNTVFTGHVTLRNAKDTELKYSMETRLPFEIGNGKSFEENEIKIGDCVKVTVKFILNRRHLNLLQDENLYHQDDSHGLKLEKRVISNDSNKTSKMVQFRDVISVKYRNTKIDQLIPLRAQIYFPEFTVSKSSIDFEVCFVGETSKNFLRIFNKSNSASVLFFKIVNDSDSIFELSIQCGFIQSQDFNLGQSQIEVSIAFTPKKSIDYSASLMISGIMGEEDREIPIIGIGSYDNKYQNKY